MSRLDEVKARLQWRYLDGLQAKISALEVAEKALGGEDRDAAVACVRRIAHQLRGSGGSYGWPQISAAAAALEEAPEDSLAEALVSLVTTLRRTYASVSPRTQTNILIIEDDQELAELIESQLAAPGRVFHHARSCAQAERALNDRVYGLVLLDLILPDGDGRSLLVDLQKQPEMANVPVFVMSVHLGALHKTESLALGADQFFEKPLDFGLLSTAVASKLNQQRQIEQEARQDSLTGLPNRTAFREAFARIQSLSERTGSHLALAILDIDRFKDFNDTHGHALGDEALRRIGMVLRAELRQSDLAARWGGEEFVVFFPETRRQEAVLGLRKVLDAVRSEEFSAKGGRPGHVTFSAGVVDVTPMTSLDTALDSADRLLYLAKSNGRGQVLDQAGGSALKGARILLAEDDDTVADFVCELLAQEGLSTTHFRDGEPALEAALSHPFDLVILDVKMPGLDGFSVLGRLREEANYRRIPIIMMTAMSKEEQLEQAFELGADDYLRKPFDARELLARVRRALRRQAL